MDVAADLAAERVRLAQALAAVASVDAAMEFQLALSAGIRAAESLSDRQEAKFHINLLRRMGDALAEQVLPLHIIRELGRDGAKPLHLSGQGPDFDFVLSTAQRLAEHTVVPLVADLTTLLTVGDIIAVHAHLVMVIECKNRMMPQSHVLRGRLWRQKARRDNAVAYLRGDEVVETDGTRRVAFDYDVPYSRADAAILDCIQAAERADSGVAWRQLGHHDWVAAAWPGDRPADTVRGGLGAAMREMRGDTWAYALIGGGSSFLRTGGVWHLNPYALDIPVAYRTALAEGDAMLWRFADLAPLIGAIPGCTDAAIRGDAGPRRAMRLTLVVDDIDYPISDRFLDQIEFAFLPVRTVQQALHHLCRSALEDLQSEGSGRLDESCDAQQVSAAPDNPRYGRGHPKPAELTRQSTRPNSSTAAATAACADAASPTSACTNRAVPSCSASWATNLSPTSRRRPVTTTASAPSRTAGARDRGTQTLASATDEHDLAFEQGQQGSSSPVTPLWHGSGRHRPRHTELDLPDVLDETSPVTSA